VAQRLVYLHTVSSLVATFKDLSQELLPPQVEVVHLVDEILLKWVLAQGGISPAITRRLAEHALAAEQFGADLMLCTCSSIAPSVDLAQPLVRIPLMRVDQPLVDRGLALGTRIGVAATAPTTLKPTTELLKARAAQAGKAVQVDAILCVEAYQAMFAGDLATHDRLVRQVLLDLMARNEVVLLAQASMARAAETIPPQERRAPLLASPRLAVEAVRDRLKELAP
jgi:Asp/Glu/hydantoin racemase